MLFVILLGAAVELAIRFGVITFVEDPDEQIEFERRTREFRENALRVRPTSSRAERSPTRRELGLPRRRHRKGSDERQSVPQQPEVLPTPHLRRQAPFDTSRPFSLDASGYLRDIRETHGYGTVEDAVGEAGVQQRPYDTPPTRVVCSQCGRNPGQRLQKSHLRMLMPEDTEEAVDQHD